MVMPDIALVIAIKGEWREWLTPATQLFPVNKKRWKR
jgi:hypothetical protein